MRKTLDCAGILLVMLTLVMAEQAQDETSRQTYRAAAPTVTISVTERGVRFAGLDSFGKIRLEVFNADGVSLYNSDFGAASVRDWTLEDKDGQRVPDGTYLCVITIRDLSGRMSTKQGSVVVQAGQPSLTLPDGESVQVLEQDKSLARVTDPADNALTLIGHDGKNGQVANTRGALTFRFGDFFSGKDKELMRLTPEGNLGIGTSAPEFKLDVAGVVRAREGFAFKNGSTLNVNDNGALTLRNGNGKGEVTLTNGNGTVTPNAAGTGTQNYIAKWAETGGLGTLQNSGIFETAAGNIGIGTSSPDSLLNIQGAIPFLLGHMSMIRTTGANHGFGLQMDATGSGNNNLAFSVNGNPKASFAWDNANNFLGFINFNYSPNAFALRINSDGSLTYHDGASSAERFRITSAGNVGIGTNNPQAPLDVNGNFNVTGNATVSGNIAAKYQDIAEWTLARTALPSGVVVSIDVSKSNAVMASNKAYDTRVAGVVSAQPGVALGEGGPNRVLVATTGRVKVRVDANRYPIHVGDLLVTSATPGVAMKSQPFRVRGKMMHRPGTIIGKALESLDEGEGTILVLLSLQ